MKTLSSFINESKSFNISHRDFKYLSHKWFEDNERLTSNILKFLDILFEGKFKSDLKKNIDAMSSSEKYAIKHDDEILIHELDSDQYSPENIFKKCDRACSQSTKWSEDLCDEDYLKEMYDTVCDQLENKEDFGKLMEKYLTIRFLDML